MNHQSMKLFTGSKEWMTEKSYMCVYSEMHVICNQEKKPESLLNNI